jgi:hypothetical protein
MIAGKLVIGLQLSAISIQQLRLKADGQKLKAV